MRTNTLLEKTDEYAPRTFVNGEALSLLLFLWVVVAIVLAIPNFASKTILIVLLGLLFSLTMLVTVVQPTTGFAAWGLIICLMVTQTGYQFSVSRILISALECIIVLLLILLIWWRRDRLIPLWLRGLDWPGKRWFMLFAVYAGLQFGRGILVDATPWDLILIQSKGFLVYPAMVLVVWFSFRSVILLRRSIIFMLGWYALIAALGLWQFVSGQGKIDELTEAVRVSANYAPINYFGITLMAVALFLVGFAIYSQNPKVKLVSLLLSLWMLLSATTSLARTVWVAFGVAMLALLFTPALRRRWQLLALLGLAVLILALLPQNSLDRILQLTDSSTQRRAYYLTSGWESFLANPIIGWGWGRAFWFIPGIGLVPTDFVPWYHNDYLNLAVQTGLIGLILYAGYWLRIIGTGLQWVRVHSSSPLTPYVVGSLAALIGLLASAAFDHTLWRPDIAGLLGWFGGILLASMSLASAETSSPTG